ncbi:hypothetical protein ABGB12_15085 [Actinocorallia sp. B10E7]|uniref:hypothetical protein n=1 Tax=Actinocorallia sp. B10E7 TaxID=3153558 RepID=UPI00325EA9DF
MRTPLNVLVGAALAVPAVLGPPSAAHAADCAATTDRWSAPVLTRAEFRPTAINNAGQIVGYKGGPGYGQHGVVYKDGGLTDLPALFGGSDGKATDIDDQGRITGSSKNLGGRTHAVVWKDGKVTELGGFFGPESIGNAISNGQIAATADADDGTADAYARKRAIRFGLNGTQIDLDADQGSTTVGINRVGEITGTQNLSKAVVESPYDRVQRAFITHGDSAFDLGTLGGSWSEAVALNDDGHVIGYSAAGPQGANGAAFYWSVETRMKRLADFGGEAKPAAINNAGDIAGQLACPQGTQTDLSQAAVWSDEGAAAAFLPRPSVEGRTFAVDINDNGDVLGYVQAPITNNIQVILWKKA